MIKRKYRALRTLRFFSLLEVLVALMLISLLFPLLIAPFTYAKVDFEENTRSIKIERASQMCLSSFLIDLHLEKLNIHQFENKTVHPIPPEWLQEIDPERRLSGTYYCEKLQPKKQEEEEGEKKIELWQVVFSFTEVKQKTKALFGYDFVVVSANNVQGAPS